MSVGSLVWIAAYKRLLSITQTRANEPGLIAGDAPGFTLHVSDLLLESGIRQGRALFDLAGPIVGSLATVSLRRDEEVSGSWDVTRCRIGIERHEAGVDLSVEGTLVPGNDLKAEWRRLDITEFYFRALVPTTDLTALFLEPRWSTPEQGLAYLIGAINLP